MATKTITVLDPAVEPKTKDFRMAVRPDNLEGKVVGLLWNRKPNGDVLLDRLSQLLDEKYHLAQSVRCDKHVASMPATEEQLSELATKCDFVITAVGD
ncbi:hypothetical protein ACFLUZ_00760 [Chloroflexota bacterium]